jgi:hypothetical protein
MLSGGLLWSQQRPPSPYPWQTKREVPLLLGAGVLVGGSSLIQRSLEPISETQRLALDPGQILAFDRGIVSQWRPQAAHTSDALLIGSLALPYGMTLLSRFRPYWKDHLLMTHEVMFLTYGLTNLTKVLVLRPRPLMYLDDPAVSHLQAEVDARFSFFSGHTSMTTASCWYSATVFQQLYPESPARHWVWAGAVLIPAVTGLLRIRSNKHFTSDVIVGYAVGAAVGTLIPRIRRRK